MADGDSPAPASSRSVRFFALSTSRVKTMSGSFHHFLPDAVRPVERPAERTVLCVQPVIEKQDFLKQALVGFRVVMAANGLEAIRIRNQSEFDAYIVDYWLPDWAGVSLCRDIRKTDPNVPIIVFTSAGSEYEQRALRAGAMMFLKPPVDPDVLRQRLRVLIRTSDVHDLRARMEAERVIEEELKRRAEAAKERTEAAMLQAEGAIERAARIKALKAFLAAGGTIAGFDRSWPQQFAAARDRDRSRS